MKLTLQAFNDGAWQDAYLITLVKPEQGRNGAARLQAFKGYAASYFDQAGAYSFTAHHAVNPMDIQAYSSWPAIFDDLMPTGYARLQWLNLLGLQHAAATEQDIELLSRGIIAPIGNLRLKESVEYVLTEHSDALDVMRFPQSMLIQRDHDFLSYARQRGAVSGGATGAGGAAPKVLVRMNANQEVWVDTFQQDNSDDIHFLVKFPRGNTAIDQDILRAEYHYYHELETLGFSTIDISQMALHEGERHPSLWLPRFDRQWCDGQVLRHGVESVFALLNKPSGSYLSHQDVLQVLVSVVNTVTTEALVCEYLQRDLLNVAFGNTDNHGRNMAVLKKGMNVSLAPIYDFAPMKADPEQVLRTTTWGNTFELGGDIHWFALCDSLADYGDPQVFKSHLSDLAVKLVDLPVRLQQRGVPESVLTMPAMGFSRLPQRLRDWGLIQ